ncbi:uncharacterized protein A4U43_C05F33630 [Asparagus officinalis]|uniref:Uncharacterized protein n=1 Tax=Asparagus officinalis TaxID=4686 RepID=A0A5P1EWF5_ASPOF|nr:uncharacterized protein A4U43_C05F33630 [Asparagus officinalis]
MEGSGAGKGGAEVAEVSGGGELPNCCKKATASLPESEAKLHATIVSGWLSETPLSTGQYLEIYLLRQEIGIEVDGYVGTQLGNA